ncbi:MAG TPA: hypothetical protein VGJ83_00160 [Gemmatimonadales bacterium]
MQRIAGVLVGLAVCAGPPPARAQEAAGTALWRLVATTLPVPPALSLGAAGSFWNPAQVEDSARAQLAIEGVETSAAIGASGVLAALKVRAGKVGYVGLIYGRVGLTDLTRTGDSPDAVGSSVPVYTSAVGVTWSRAIGRTAVGATARYHVTRLDDIERSRSTFDVGASREVVPGLRLAAATHFVSSFRADPAQDIYAGVEYRLWQGPLWGDHGVLRGRYGLAFAHGFTADHQAGVGLEVGTAVALDVAVAREGGYSDAGWRPAAGMRLAIGKYRVTIARDAGLNDLGSAYRVGVEARFR